MSNTAADPSPLDPLDRMPPDEPRFVLRGKDPAAPRAIREWAAATRLQAYRQHIDAENNPKSHSDRDAYKAKLLKCAEAEILADEMDDWRTKSGEAEPGVRALYDESARTAEQVEALKAKQRLDQARAHIQEGRYHLKEALELTEKHGIVGLDPYYTDAALQYFGEFADNLTMKGE